ncbi:MAG: SdrD B-like domain-containing protein [Limnochordia bacterium]|jgi:hypothetical protein
MRFFRSTGILITMCLVWLMAWSNEPARASLSEMDTSVVRLDINDRKFSEDFELYDDGETVLLPLSQVGQLLDAKVNLDPVLMAATVVRPWDGLEGLVDLQRQVCFWGEEQLVMSPHAELGPGDFYVPLPIVERLMDVQAVWKPETQVLRITVGRQLSKLRPAAGTPSDSVVTSEEFEPSPTRTPPMVSLGAIQYVLRHELTVQGSEEHRQDSLALSAHWQAAGIPVDIAVSATDVLSPHPRWELKRATATYLSPDVEVVAGDTSLSLGRVLQSKEIRGLRLAAPPGWTSGVLHAVTTIEGWVADGSEVELRVNGAYFGKQVATDGYYAFRHVPLQITRANRLEIVVIETSGLRRVETRVLTATPRLLSAGKLQASAGGGWVRSEKTGEWDSAVMGASAYTGVTSWLTVGGELARQVILDGSQDHPDHLAGAIGLALRASDGLVFALDWLASQPQGAVGAPAQGAELTASLRMGRTSWQSMIFYREPDLYLFSPGAPDTQGFRVVGEYNINRAWSLQGSYELATSVSDSSRSPRTRVGGVLQWTPSLDRSVVLRLNHVPRDRDRVSLTHRYSNVQKGTELKSESEATWVERPQASPVLTNVSARLEFDQALDSASYLGLRYRGVADWPLGGDLSRRGFALLTNTVQVDATWMPGTWHVYGAVQMTDARDTSGGTPPFYESGAVLSISRITGVWVSGMASELIHMRRNSTPLGSIVNGVYVGARPEPKALVLLKLEHTQPLWSGVFRESMGISLSADGQLRNGFHLSALGRVTVTHAQPEYYLGVTLSQGIGFSEGGVRGFRVVDGRPLGYVTGTVYIDANRNGRRDAGEKTVAGAPIALAGRRTVTDRDGRYCFEFVNPGTYRLGLDPNKLSADYTPYSDPVVIRLPANANLSQDFGVTLNGTVEGTVFVDLNGDGLWQPEEPRPAWVKVALNGTIEAFTDSRGNFTLSNVNLGTYQLAVPESSLPPGTIAPAPIDIKITEDNLDVWGIRVPLTLMGN